MAGELRYTKFNDEQNRAFITYAQSAHTLLLNQFSLRTQLEEIDRYYMREGDFTDAHVKARFANRRGDKKKFQDVTVPVVMPQVEAALGYLCNVFLTGYPTFGVAADPANEAAALQMETIIAENSVTAGWVRQLIMFFRDGLKYNWHGLELDWQQKTVYNIETDVTMPNNAKPKTSLWKGNVLKRLDPYNTFFDPRVHPAELHSEGEFAGYIEIMSRVRMKKYINDLFGSLDPKIAIQALESAPATAGMGATGSPFSYYMPIVNPFPTMNNSRAIGFDWMAWATNNAGGRDGIKYSNIYEKMVLYARIIPADFKLDVPEKNTPQIWKFVIINGQVVLFGERLSNAHNFLPIVCGQPIEDGLDFQTKSFATNVQDFQDLSSAMVNGYIASKRRLVGDRVIYNPAMIRKEDIESINPAAKIPLRPSAYGKAPAEAVYQFPYHDERTDSFLQGSKTILDMADLVNGQNPAQQGQFVKGNKTRHEYEDVMGHGNTRNQIMGLMTEHQIFVPIKEMIKLNILQFQPETTLFNRDKNQQVNIKPEDLRTAAIHFKISDGMSPADLQLSGDEFQTALQVLGSSPQIAGEYNLGPLFSYIMKMRGADLTPFEKPQDQVLYEQQMAQWQQMAEEYLKKGQEFKAPQPQIPASMQQQKPNQAAPSPEASALEATQGSS